MQQSVPRAAVAVAAGFAVAAAGLFRRMVVMMPVK